MKNESIDYNKQLKHAKEIPRFYLGQEVNTEFGKGIVVEMHVPSNGLYISSHLARCVVWYSTEKADPWIQRGFTLKQLEEQNG